MTSVQMGPGTSSDHASERAESGARSADESRVRGEQGCMAPQRDDHRSALSARSIHPQHVGGSAAFEPETCTEGALAAAGSAVGGDAEEDREETREDPPQTAQVDADTAHARLAAIGAVAAERRADGKRSQKRKVADTGHVPAKRQMVVSPLTVHRQVRGRYMWTDAQLGVRVGSKRPRQMGDSARRPATRQRTEQSRIFDDGG